MAHRREPPVLDVSEQNIQNFGQGDFELARMDVTRCVGADNASTINNKLRSASVADAFRVRREVCFVPLDRLGVITNNMCVLGSDIMYTLSYLLSMHLVFCIFFCFPFVCVAHQFQKSIETRVECSKAC